MLAPQRRRKETKPQSQTALPRMGEQSRTIGDSRYPITPQDLCVGVQKSDLLYNKHINFNTSLNKLQNNHILLPL